MSFVWGAGSDAILDVNPPSRLDLGTTRREFRATSLKVILELAKGQRIPLLAATAPQHLLGMPARYIGQ